MLMEEISSPPLPIAGLGPHELSFSHSRIDLDHHWVFWGSCNDKVHNDNPHLLATADDAVIKSQIISFLQRLPISDFVDHLVQFWGLVKIDNKMYLTTCDQPFSLLYCDERMKVKQLCEYRKHCLGYLIPVDDVKISVDQTQFGPLGRVFHSGLPESTDDARHYTNIEYPQRNWAGVHVMQYCALPVYHPTQHLPSGVLEIVSPYNIIWPQNEILGKLQEVNLTTTISNLKEVSSCQRREMNKIAQVLTVVCRRYQLVDAITWTTSGEILCTDQLGRHFIRKGQGIVGKAFSSKNACFCRDVRRLSITEYPSVPNARRFGYFGCFAVCLQSTCSNNCIYVLEFFLPTNEKHYWDPRTLLDMLMESLKQHLLGSFKIASGQELGQKLFVEVIKVSPEDEFDSIEICNTNCIESTPRLAEVQGGEGIMQLDISPQQVDVANGSISGIHEQQNGSVGFTPRHAEVQQGEEMMQLDFSFKQFHDVDGSMNGIHGQQNEIVGSLPRQKHVHGFVNISNQELLEVEFSASNLAGIDSAIDSTNGIYEQQNGIVGSLIGQEPAQNMVSLAHHETIAGINVANSLRDGVSVEQRAKEATDLEEQMLSYTLKRKLGITSEAFEQNSTKNLDDTATALGACQSASKRICRDYSVCR